MQVLDNTVDKILLDVGTAIKKNEAKPKRKRGRKPRNEVLMDIDEVLPLLKPHEKIICQDKTERPRLSGLIRVAKDRGLKEMESVVTQSPSPGNDYAATVHAHVVFDRKIARDKKHAIHGKYAASADCTMANSSGIYQTHPTASAESRAYARCLRFALDLAVMAIEEAETVVNNGAPNNQKVEVSQETLNTTPPQESQLRAIEVLAERKKVDINKVLKSLNYDPKCLKEIKSKADASAVLTALLNLKE